jgi:hypothetical protein
LTGRHAPGAGTPPDTLEVRRLPRASTRFIGLGIAVLLLATAALLSQLDIRLASSQAISIVARQTKEKVPLNDPLASVWDGVTPVQIPLSAQGAVVPIGGGSIRAVSVRSLTDGKRMYFRLEWDDQTKNTSAFAPQEFRDAAAIEFPANGASTTPSFCMGQANSNVNIWQWKGDWQADIDQGFVSVPHAYPNAEADLYPFHDDVTFYPGRAVGNPFSQTNRKSPVQDLVAAGFGTLTGADAQSVEGKGIWQGGRWYVLFARDMNMGFDREFYVPFGAGQTTNVAFAVWDGANSERDGLKSVSSFADLQIEKEAEATNVTSLVVLGVLAAFGLLGFCYLLYQERLKPRV